MTKTLKAASIAAMTVTLASIFLTADSGLASGREWQAGLDGNAITVDSALIAAENSGSSGAQVAAEEENTISITKQAAAWGAEVPAQAAAAPSGDEDKAESLADLVEVQDASVQLDEQMKCLAGAVYFESKGESLAGQLAVADVIISRSKSGRFPDSYCGVVHQKGQFSFVRGNQMPAIPDNRHWRTAKAIALIAHRDTWQSPVEGALFFHARRVSPGWKLTRLGAVDNHVFYR